MTESDNGNKGVAVSVPVGALGAAAALALAGAGYAYFMRSSAEPDENGQKPRSGGLRRRLSLMTAIALIENDATRKLVVAALRAMAKRA